MFFNFVVKFGVSKVDGSEKKPNGLKKTVVAWRWNENVWKHRCIKTYKMKGHPQNMRLSVVAISIMWKIGLWPAFRRVPHHAMVTYVALPSWIRRNLSFERHCSVSYQPQSIPGGSTVGLSTSSNKTRAKWWYAWHGTLTVQPRQDPLKRGYM